MKFTISKGERVLISTLISDLEGVNRTDARLVSKVDEHLELNEVRISIPFADLDQVNEFELAELEVSWILDHINKAFDKQEVLPYLAKHALSFEEKLKAEPEKPKKKS